MRIPPVVRALVVIVTCLAGAARASAQPPTQVVTFAVNAINVIAFTGSPSLTVVTAVAGASPTTVTNSTARWAVTTNQTGAKITGSIASAMPAGLTLSANLAAPTGGTSLGYKALGTVAVDLVTNITKRNQINRVVNYRLAATSAAGVVPSSTRLVTYTITGGT